MRSFVRVDENIVIGGEAFVLKDIVDVVPEYECTSKVHYYDGKAHYKSDGMNQTDGFIPCATMEKILDNITGIRYCKEQRETDERHIEFLRKSGGNDGDKLKRRS